MTPQKGANTMDGVSMIAAERKRQIEEEGWSAEHDDWHDDGELALAAASYAAGEAVFVQRTYSAGADARLPVITFCHAWPFDKKWYKPKGRIRDLVRAGAMIAAEIDRLQRSGESA